MHLVLSCNTLVSPSMVIESFAGYSSLGWHLCSLRVCMTSEDSDFRAWLLLNVYQFCTISLKIATHTIVPWGSFVLMESPYSELAP